MVVIESLHGPTVAALRDDPSAAPTLARLMEQGSTFERAYAQSGWTMPGLASLLTGRYPQLTQEGSGASALSGREDRSLPAILEHYGYTTAAIWGATLACGFSGDLPFHWVSPTRCGPSHVTFDTPLAEWTQALAREPFFVLVHNIDLHTPEPAAPEAWLHRFVDDHPACPGTGTAFIYHQLAPDMGDQAAKDHVVGHYRGQLAYYDQALGRMLDRLETAGLMEDTVVVVTTNHGQDLFEHSCFDHGLHYDSVLHIPMLWVEPGRETPDVDARVQTVDLAPTILARAGIPYAGLDGASLLPLMELGPGDYPERDVYSVTNRHNASLRSATHKLVLTQGVRGASCEAAGGPPRPGARPPLGRPHYELYDLLADPGEQDDLYDSHPELAEPMVGALDAWLDGLELAASGSLPSPNDKARRTLQKEGYWDQVHPDPQGRPARPPKGERAGDAKREKGR